ncbi:carbohydrate ABC transporter permease, partial [Rhizobium ruizarguesonis]
FLSGGPIQPIDWLGDPNWALFSIVLLSAWQAYGFPMIIYLAGLQGIPEELYDAARIEGASALRRFWHVTMPGLRPTHVFVLV